MMSLQRHGYEKSSYFTGEKGFLFSGFDINQNSIHTGFSIKPIHAGWPNIPHGGIGMTAVIELVSHLHNGFLTYPFSAKYRFGGEKLTIGDDVDISVEQNGCEFLGKMLKSTGGHPYMTAAVSLAPALERAVCYDDIGALLSKDVINESSFVMPNFSGKIIFLPDEQCKHTIREFTFVEVPDRIMYMLSTIKKGAAGAMNRIAEDQVHPGVLITILDETLGWAGFFSAWQGGVTVDLAVHFLEPVRPDDAIFTVGFCRDMYGSYARKIVLCAGGIFSGTRESPKPLVYAEGRWLTRPDYKEKMLKFLGYYLP